MTGTWWNDLNFGCSGGLVVAIRCERSERISFVPNHILGKPEVDCPVTWVGGYNQHRKLNPLFSKSVQIDEFVAQQFLFQHQWLALKKYANEAGISIMGDMPIYVGGHSADVWANRKSFALVSSRNFSSALRCARSCWKYR
jgi:hypothetical protein